MTVYGTTRCLCGRQIILDSLLTFYEVSRPAMSQHFYPTVVAESVYGSFDVAIDHLNRKLIATRNPEQIRGGGLLKYCNLVVRNFRHACRSHMSDHLYHAYYKKEHRHFRIRDTL